MVKKYLQNWLKKFGLYVVAATIALAPVSVITISKLDDINLVNQQQHIASEYLKKNFRMEPSAFYHFYGYTPVLCHFYENGYPYIARDKHGKEHRGTICVEKETDKPRLVFDTSSFPNPIIATTDENGVVTQQQVLVPAQGS